MKKGDILMEIVCMRVNRTCWQVEKIRKVMQVIFHMLNNGYQVFAVGWIQPDGTSIFSGPQHCHSHHIVIPATTSFPQQRHSRERESRKGNLFSQVVYSWQQRWTRELTRQWRLRLKMNRTRRALAMSAGFSFRCPVFRRIHTGIGT